MTEEVAVTMASAGAAGATTAGGGPPGEVPPGGVASRPRRESGDVEPAGVKPSGADPPSADPLSADPAAVEPAGLPGPGLLNGGQAARPQLIRALNEQLLLGHIRQLGPCSRADLARLSGLSKPTVSLALANVERSGLVRIAGQRTGMPGRSARLYEVRPEAGLVLGLDIGLQYLRGALADLAGDIRAKAHARARASSVTGRVAELIRLADTLCADAGLNRSAITQTVIGSPGFYDPRRNAMALTGQLSGWNRPAVLAGLREAFGQHLVVENDVDAAALAEQAHGHGREFGSFAFVWIGTGIGMGLVLDGRLHRGVHGAAGEIAFMPLSEGHGTDEGDARRRGPLEASASASAVVRAARRAGMRGPVSARRVFTAAAQGDERAAAVVAQEARLVAKAVCSVVTVVDPELVVLGGGIGQAPGFADAVMAELRQFSPVLPEVRVSALGTDAVVDGCLAAGSELAWRQLTAVLPSAPAADAGPGGRPGPGGLSGPGQVQSWGR
jgi:predicted NBD/HSP70 family sugar kinase